MAIAITYDQHTPQAVGNYAIITGKIVLLTATLGVIFSEIEKMFSFGKVYTVNFEHNNGYSAEYRRIDKKLYCKKPDGSVSNGETLTFYFTAIGQGGGNV